jgi:hypothetical protein
MASGKRASPRTSRSKKKDSQEAESPTSSTVPYPGDAASLATPTETNLSALSTSPSSLLDTSQPPEDASSLLQSIISLLGSDPLKQVQKLVKYESKFGGVPLELLPRHRHTLIHSIDIDLTNAFKLLQKKNQAMESLLKDAFQIGSLATTADLEWAKAVVATSQQDQQVRRLHTLALL